MHPWHSKQNIENATIYTLMYMYINLRMFVCVCVCVCVCLCVIGPGERVRRNAEKERRTK